MMRINDGKGAIIMNKIAEFIKINRKAAGLTQEEFAMRSGLGQVLVSSIGGNGLTLAIRN